MKQYKKATESRSDTPQLESNMADATVTPLAPQLEKIQKRRSVAG